jgi:hypothetical protein
MRLRRERHEAGRHEGELEAGRVSLASKRWSDDESGIAAIQRRSRAQVNWAPSRIKWFEVMRECGDEVRELLHDGCPAACRRCALLPRQCFHFARQRGLLSLAPDLIATTSVVAQACLCPPQRGMPDGLQRLLVPGRIFVARSVFPRLRRLTWVASGRVVWQA